MAAFPKIDKKLNIVHVIENGQGASVQVHATPISKFVFEQYFLLISKTFTALYTEGLLISGPRVAMTMMKTVAQGMGPKVWEDAQGGLIAEIVRLANVVVRDPNGAGWATVPLHGAVERGVLSEEDRDEIDGVLIFFTCASCMHTRSQLPGIMAGMQLWGTHTSLLNATEYANSLPMSTPDGTGLTTVNPLSVPS
jgi:hypothetical protein